MGKKKLKYFTKVCNLNLKTNHDSLLNCFGIQPIFHRNWKIEQSYLGFVYRMATSSNRKGTMKYLTKCRLGEENDIIIKNKFHYNDSTKQVISTILKNSFTLKHTTSLDVLMQDDNLLKETLYYYLKRIELYISLGYGNFIITSRQDLYYKKFFMASEIKNFQIYLVDEYYLPNNVLIFGHRNSNSFGCPYLACPLIDENHFDEICQMNGIKLNDIDYNMDKKYPIIDHQLNLYSLYQSYLDNVDVPYWYIETFRNPTSTRQQAYYTTILFE